MPLVQTTIYFSTASANSVLLWHFSAKLFMALNYNLGMYPSSQPFIIALSDSSPGLWKAGR